MTRLFLVLFPILLVTACAEEVMERPMVEVVVEPVVLEPYQPESEYVGRDQ